MKKQVFVLVFALILSLTGCGGNGSNDFNSFATEYPRGTLSLGDTCGGFQSINLENISVNDTGHVSGTAVKHRQIGSQVAIGSLTGHIDRDGNYNIVCTFSESWAGVYEATGKFNWSKGVAFGSAEIVHTRDWDVTHFSGSDIWVRLDTLNGK